MRKSTNKVWSEITAGDEVLLKKWQGRKEMK